MNTVATGSARNADAMSRGAAVSCPHCGHRALIRSSRLITQNYRELFAGCPNCFFTGKAHVAWDVEINPSLLPHPTVNLPRLAISIAVEQFFLEESRKHKQHDLFAGPVTGVK